MSTRTPTSTSASATSTRSPRSSGTHTAATSTNLFDGTKNFKKVGFDPANAESNEHGQNLLNLTLRNKTTGASCTIKTINENELECDLSGGTRSGDDLNKNKWKTGDEYLVEGNALGFLGYILDNLDKLVDQIDQIDPGLTDKEIPLIGISTKDLVGKIKSIKQTIDELRGAPLAEIDCTGNPDGTNPATDSLGRPFNIELLPDNTPLWCRAVSTAHPTDVTWSGLKGSIAVEPGAFLPGAGTGGNPPVGGDILGTVGPDETGTAQDDRVKVTVSDGNATFADDTAIDEWQIKAEFTDGAGNHTAEFPSSLPPQSLQQLSDLINEKLGVDHVINLDLLDLPAAGDGPKTSGQATAGSDADHVLEDTSTDFPALPEAQRPDVGNLLINKTDKKHCTISAVGTHTITCALGSGMQWDNNDDYEVVGNGTKDLVVSLGVGFCSGGGLCESNDRSVPAVQAPLNMDTGFADLIAVDTQGKLELDYDATAQLDACSPRRSRPPVPRPWRHGPSGDSPASRRVAHHRGPSPRGRSR